MNNTTETKFNPAILTLVILVGMVALTLIVGAIITAPHHTTPQEQTQTKTVATSKARVCKYTTETYVKEYQVIIRDLKCDDGRVFTAWTYVDDPAEKHFP